MTITLPPPQSERGHLEQVQVMLSEPQTPDLPRAKLSSGGVETGDSRPGSAWETPSPHARPFLSQVLGTATPI